MRQISAARRLLVIAAAIFAFPSAAAAACSWQLVPSINPSTINVLNGVAGSSTSDVWAVGRFKVSGSPNTLAEHWNGSAWSVVTTPNGGPSGGALFSVAALSATDAWAVGLSNTPSGGSQALILHWNGTGWTQVSAPPIAGEFVDLQHLAAISPKNVWAVGQGFNSSTGVAATVVEHWNGKQWSVVPSPNPGTYGSELAAVSATSPNDVWASGGTFTNSAQSSLVTLTEHWNGHTWTVVPSQNANSNDNLFNAMVAIAPNDAWAMGDYYTGTIFNTLIEHWNGTAWSIVRSPNVGTAGDGLFGAAAFSTKAVWAVGETFTAGGGGVTLSLKWNGKKWLVVKSPNLSGGNPDYFNGAGAIRGSTTLWAVGGSNYLSTGGHDMTLTADNACAALDVQDDTAVPAPWELRIPGNATRVPFGGAPIR